MPAPGSASAPSRPLPVEEHPAPTARPVVDRVAGQVGPTTQRLLEGFDRHRWWLLAAVALLYAAGFNGRWRIGPDSALHLIIARSLAAGEGFDSPGHYQGQVHPGLACLLAGPFGVFGSDTLWPAHVTMLVIALTTLGLTYALLKLHAGRPTAVLATSLLAGTETFYRYAFHLLTDMPFLTGTVLCLLGFERLESENRSRWPGFVMIVAGTLWMAAFRAVVLTVVAAMLVALVWWIIRSRRRWSYVAIAALILVSLLLARALDPRLTRLADLSLDERTLHRLIEQEPVHRALTKNLPQLLNEAASEAAFGVDLGPVASVPVSLIVLAAGIALMRRRVLWGLLVLAFTAQWLLFVVADRYFLAILPLLVFGWWQAAAANSRLPAPTTAWLPTTALVLWLAPNLVMIGAFIVEQRSGPFYSTYERGKYVHLVEMATWLKAQSPPDALVISSANPSRELAFLSHRAVKKAQRIDDADRRRSKLYVLEPIDPRTARWLRRQQWQVGPPVDTGASADAQDLWTLRPLILPGAPGSQSVAP